MRGFGKGKQFGTGREDCPFIEVIVSGDVYEAFLSDSNGVHTESIGRAPNEIEMDRKIEEYARDNGLTLYRVENSLKKDQQ